jgi:hypothetical protein
MSDNAFVHIADYAAANQLANEFDLEILPLRLDEFAQQYCPVVTDLKINYHWSSMQTEYATDLVFKNRDALQAFYPQLLETLTHAVKPADIATFLGRKLNGNYQGEMGNRFNKRWLGTRIKHPMGPVSIKMYDKSHSFCALRPRSTTSRFSSTTAKCNIGMAQPQRVGLL